MRFNTIWQLAILAVAMQYGEYSILISIATGQLLYTLLFIWKVEREFTMILKQHTLSLITHLEKQPWQLSFTYNKDNNQKFIKRSKESPETLSMVYSVHSKYDECYFLRLLIFEVRGPKSFEDLLMVDGGECLNYKEACVKRGLLENDEH